MQHIRTAVTLFTSAVLAGVALAACGNSGATGGSATLTTAAKTAATVTGTPRKGGTAYFAEAPLSPPNYIFPMMSGDNYTTANANDFQTLMYEPLYWFGDGGKAGVDDSLSLGDQPVYSNQDRTVTIKLKDWQWSNGETVSARDVIFWINLLKGEKDNWASYVPGGFPDNVVSSQVVNPHTVRLQLNRSYNPIWYTDNELSQITPLPLAWDRTSLTAPAPQAGANNLPDATTKGARGVYDFLNAQAKDLSTYATSSVWSVVDGPWKLTELTSSGEARFVPNTRYSGPHHPHLSAFVELPYTSEDAELSVLRASSSSGNTSGGSAQQITVGYVPADDLPQSSTLQHQGYRLQAFYPQGLDYFIPNFNNPTAGPIFKQLYFRQAFQHLIDQKGWIKAYFHGLAVPTYSGVPNQPANPYSNALAKTNPYPFSIAAAKALLKAHGWKVVPGGVSTCANPGSGAGECGAGIAAGQGLRLTMIYSNDRSSVADGMADLQSVARRVGIALTLKPATSSTVSADVEPCTPKQSACNWQIGQYGGAWYFQPDHYPSGEEYFQSGAIGNEGSYVDARMDKLIEATETVPSSQSQATLNAYANYARKQLPVFWQPSPGTLVTLAGNLGGYTPNAYDFINPEEWYFVK